jgi:NADP-dependent 3-hydroxy acid dehydrogenase YdfG
MDEKLTGTVALVTGASSGIGAATGRELARRGAAVALVARRGDRLERLAADIEDEGGRAVALAADITDQRQAIDAVERTVADLGRLDTVVNNAGVMLLGPILGAPTEEWDRMISLNLQGLLYVSHAALPHLVTAAGSGPRQVADLVNISSVAGRRATPMSGIYNLTKFGVNAFTEALRQEITERHVRVSVVEPGAVLTELTEHLRPEARDHARQALAGVENLLAEDIADGIGYIVTRPRRVAVNELLIRPTEQVR